MGGAGDFDPWSTSGEIVERSGAIRRLRANGWNDLLHGARAAQRWDGESVAFATHSLALVFLEEMRKHPYNANHIKSKSLSDHKVQLISSTLLQLIANWQGFCGIIQFFVRDAIQTGREKGRHYREGVIAAVWRLVGCTETKNISQHRELEIKNLGCFPCRLAIGHWKQDRSSMATQCLRVRILIPLCIIHLSVCEGWHFTLNIGWHWQLPACFQVLQFYMTLLVQTFLLFVWVVQVACCNFNPRLPFVCMIAIRGWCLWAPC